MTLFVSDLDGTLIDSRLTIPPESVAGIHAAIARGDCFAAATARTPATAGEILAPLVGALPAVVMNGAGIYDFAQQKFVHLAPLPGEKADAVRRLLDELEIGGFLYTLRDNHLYVYYERLENLSQQMFYDLRKDKPFKTFVQGEQEAGTMPLFFCVIDTGERTARLAQALQSISGVTAHRYRDTYQADSWYVEVYDELASKAAGVRWLKEQYGCEKAVCFGDNRNDLDMFEAADACYAVANAVEELKACATATLADPDLTAVGRFIGSYR